MRVLILLIAMSLAACGSSSHENPGSSGGQGEQGGGEIGDVNFAMVTEAFGRNRCLTCHSTQNHAAGIDLEQYSTAKGFATSIRSAVDDGSMPLRGPRVGARDAAIIDAWVLQGAPQ